MSVNITLMLQYTGLRSEVRVHDVAEETSHLKFKVVSRVTGQTGEKTCSKHQGPKVRRGVET